MANYLRNLSIGQYRGISRLIVNNLNSVNIIVGDNNSGKTSLLEAIYLLRAPHSFNNVLSACRLRNTPAPLSPSNLSLYESFLTIFPKTSQSKGIYVSAIGDSGPISVEVSGEVTTAIVDSEDLKQYPVSIRYAKERTILGSESPAFLGTLHSTVRTQQKDTPIRLMPISRISTNVSLRSASTNIVYLSPISHITDSAFYSIVKSENYKDICIQLIKLFDPDIEDLVYMPNDITGRAVEYIKSRRLGLMPLVTYGDGIKKVLSLANSIIEAKDGILLIDEIDTSIHYRFYKDIFRFLFKAAKKFNVQLFITTHSEEAIKEILMTQDYGTSTADIPDPITVVTLRKDQSGNVRARSMTGFEVQSNQELFNFEVRL